MSNREDDNSVSNLTIFGSRLASLEAKTASSQQHTDSQFHAVTQSLIEIRSAVTNLSQQVTNANKTDWGVLAAFGSFLLGLVGGLGYLTVTPIREQQNRVIDKLQDTRDQFYEHVSDGHPRLVEQRAESNEKAIAQLDDTLQREMRILDARGVQQIEGMDKRLQLEMRLLQESRDARQEMVDRRVTRIEEFIDQRESVPERLRSLERRAFGDDRERLNHDE